MRKLVFVYQIMMCSVVACAWNTVTELEAEASQKIMNPVCLLDTNFVSNLNNAAQSTNVIMKVDANLVKSMVYYQRFLATADGQMVDDQKKCLSNAVNLTVGMTNSWQFWAGRFLLASTYAADNDFSIAYQMSTNSIKMIQHTGVVIDTNVLSKAILTYYEMPDIELETAFKVFAGMSAAGAGIGCAATNYANQVSDPYRSTILDFIK